MRELIEDYCGPIFNIEPTPEDHKFYETKQFAKDITNVAQVLQATGLVWRMDGHERLMITTPTTHVETYHGFLRGLPDGVTRVIFYCDCYRITRSAWDLLKRIGWRIHRPVFVNEQGFGGWKTNHVIYLVEFTTAFSKIHPDQPGRDYITGPFKNLNGLLIEFQRRGFDELVNGELE